MTRPPSPFLKGRVCLVTGGAQGIGWAIAQALADHGAHVHVCDLSAEYLAAARRELPALPFGERIELAPCDVADRSQVEAWIRDVHAKAGRLDVLVNNAAFVRWEDVADMPVEDAEQTMAVGYNGMLYATKAVLPLMLAADGGHVVNIGSSMGRLFVGSSSAAYCATKAAVDAYTQTLQLELRHTPVAVTLIRLNTVAGTAFFREHVRPSRMPRLTDFLPYLTPPQVAAGVVRALRSRRAVLDLPWFLPACYLLFDLAPEVVRWMVARGGGGRRDYGSVSWRYRPASLAQRS